MSWAKVVSRMHEFYVSTVRFCALILEILLKLYVRIFLSKVSRIKTHRYLWLCRWLSQFFSQWRGKILLWICRKVASIVLQALNEVSLSFKMYGNFRHNRIAIYDFIHVFVATTIMNRLFCFFQTTFISKPLCIVSGWAKLL